MSRIFFFKLYIKLKPLISSLLWNLHHENISFHSKVIYLYTYWKIPILVLNPHPILTFDTLNRGRTVFFNGGKPGQVFSVRFERNEIFS
jgi:hypothetical protein